MNKEKMVEGVKLILTGMGVNSEDENFKETPRRVANSFCELLEGIGKESEVETILKTYFPSTYSGIIAVSPVKVYSLCPHHLLPISYTIYFAYTPTKRVLGLSKIPRFIKLLARRPMLQEQLTDDIVDFFDKYVKPEGSICIIVGEHDCMKIRGTKCDGRMVTSSIRGDYFKHPDMKREAMKLLGVKL